MTDGLQNISGLLSNLAKRFGEGLQRKVQLVPLFLSRKIVIDIRYPWENHYFYYLNAGIALIAPEQDGYRPLAFVLLKLKDEQLLPGENSRGDGQHGQILPYLATRECLRKAGFDEQDIVKGVERARQEDSRRKPECGSAMVSVSVTIMIASLVAISFQKLGVMRHY
ncbi:hypothetical protein Ddc_15210 [Ditylenchus destructor]|nr:hypothetical protein Ddc_15210 [Ditylenchus destructor]